MKKTLVALAVAALAATSANAAVVYNQDGTKLDINGSVRVLLDKTTGNRTDLKEDGSRVNFAASQDLGNGLSAVGYLRLKVDSKDTNTPSGQFKGLKVNKLYAGLAQEGIGALTFGKQDTTADDVKLGDYTYVYGSELGVTTLKDSTDKGIKFRSADFAGFSFGADYGFSKSADKTKPNENGYGLSVFYTGKFAENISLNANAGYTQNKWGTAENKAKAWLLASEVVTGPVSVGLSYGQKKVITSTDLKIKKLVLGVKYDVTESAKIYTQYNRTKKADNKAKNGYVLGVGYKLHSNVETFAEYAHIKQEKSTNGLSLGFRVFF